ncbi:type I-E CRISPR-associated protein Cse2/CasB [Streptomyces sp. 1331.2]|uniref:type I-E CRISPR-associated protein Cse2/CasB n=1 Tax=Streptomyces sp. 1331.2 TaxID=1938835 RepID=UPI000BDABB40|nr:type I-E CRISPR-associated protein Cse2/CasB [Streptomyces sp. 1331.2]SOB88484.1 CRISPR system Cascade subunit CasB [Streptomyces sp. 1331.2]
MSTTTAIPGPAKAADDAVRPSKESVLEPKLIPSLGRARAFTARIDQRSHDDPGVRAALRRGVGKDLDAVPFMHRFVASWLTDDQTRSRDIQRAFYTVASLIAAQRRDQYAAAKAATAKKEQQPKDEAEQPPTDAQPEGTEATEPPTAKRVPPRSLGHAFADGVLKGGQGGGLREASAETRLNLLTRQSVDGLHRHLPGAVRQLRGCDVEIDWAQLLIDLCHWRRRSGTVKRIWLQDYHRTLQKDGERRARENDDDQADADGTDGTDSPSPEA